MTSLLDYLPELLMSLGIIALIIEVAVLGFATFILFFVGLSLLATGIAMQMGWLSVNVTTAIWANLVVTFVLALVLWKPLKKLQNRSGSTADNEPSDFAQQTFVLTGDVNAHSDDVFYAYSGINWKVRSDQPLTQGTKVKVVKIEVSVMWVKPVNDC